MVVAMSFSLPESATGLRDAFRKQLHQSTVAHKLIVLLATVLLPIGEAILVNFATSTSTYARELWLAITIVGVIHLGLALCLLVSEQPLTQFLIEFDDLTRAAADAKDEAASMWYAYNVFEATVSAARVSLSVVNDYSPEIPTELGDLLEIVMKPWVLNRSSIFNFYDGKAMYNMAVYRKDADNVLRMAWRSSDSRIKRTDRPWPVGEGHVGVCFRKNDMIFSRDVAEEGAAELIGTGRHEDNVYYRCMVSVPIRLKGNPWGVFIVTSSEPDQFDKTIRGVIVQVLAQIISLAIARAKGVKNGRNQERRTR